MVNANLSPFEREYDVNHQYLKAEVVALSGTFSASVQEIRCASGAAEGIAEVCILSKCTFGVHGAANPVNQTYASEIMIEAGNPLKGPISSFTIKNAGSPAIVYYYDKA